MAQEKKTICTLKQLSYLQISQPIATLITLFCCFDFSFLSLTIWCQYHHIIYVRIQKFKSTMRRRGHFSIQGSNIINLNSIGQLNLYKHVTTIPHCAPCSANTCVQKFLKQSIKIVKETKMLNNGGFLVVCLN